MTDDLNYDFINWCAYNLKIINMSGNLVGLDLNIAQQKVHNTLELQRKAGLPIRAIILKARREGVSTYVEARFFYWINVLANRYACIVSADADASDKVFSMSKLFQTHLPVGLRRDTEFSSKREIKYAEPHRSQFLVQTAGKGVLGRGGLTHYIHATEFAFWDDAKTQLGGAAQEVPDKEGTEIIIESTANGMGNAYHDMYEQAVFDWRTTRDLNNYIPIFLPWFTYPEYRKPLSENFSLDENEELTARQFDLTAEQMCWRRWAIKNKCQGDDGLFRQEYPATYQEAFQASGNPVFTHDVISWQAARLTKEPALVILTGKDYDIKPEPVDRSFNCWQVKEMPRENGQYVIGIDTMEGRQSDPLDEKSKLDYHGVSIYDRLKSEIVAIYKGQGNQKELAIQCLLAARFYNDAWVAPEIPNGLVLLSLFRDENYPNIYSRTVHEQQYVERDGEDLGWRTTLVTRKWLTDDFICLLAENGILLNFSDILEEMRWFIRDRNGKPIHSAGKHDDLLFSAMIAIQAHKRCPISLPMTQTGVEYDLKAATKLRHADRDTSLSYIGAVDDDDEDDEEIDDYYHTT